MSVNPFKIGEEVKGDFVVEKTTSKIECEIPIVKLKWRSVDVGVEVLTLDEILEQVTKIIPNQINYIGTIPSIHTVPLIRIFYESAQWGVILEVGQYNENGRTWSVHGVTKGYA